MDLRDDVRQLLRWDAGALRGELCVERVDALRQQVDALGPGTDLLDPPADGEHLADEMGEEYVVGSGLDAQMEIGGSCRFGGSRVDGDEHTAAAPEVTETSHRIGDRVRVTVGDDRVGPDEEQERRALAVPDRRQARPASHELSHQGFAWCVDRGGGVLLSGTDRGEESLGGASAIGVEGRSRGEVHRDRVGPLRLDRRAHESSHGVVQFVPACGDVVPHSIHRRPDGDLRCVETFVAVMERADRPPFRTAVSPGESVVLVPSDPHHPAVVDGDDDAAHRVAYPAERHDFLRRHPPILPEMRPHRCDR